MGVITCPGEDAGYCDSSITKGYEGDCASCHLLYVDSFESYKKWHPEEVA